MHYTDYDTRLAAYAVIVDEQQRVLLALWNEADPPQWTMPGGGVEFAETAEEAAVRELREETGYDVQIGRLLGVHSHIVPAELRIGGSRPLKSVRLVFAAAIVGGCLTCEIDGTTDEARWFDLADIEGLDRVPLVDVALAMYLAARPCNEGLAVASE